MTRRHLDVDDGDVGPMRQRLPQEGFCVARVADHLEAGLRQDAHDPFAQKDVILTDDDPDGLCHDATVLLDGVKRHGR